ncbi:hypothetical protein [Sporolactobacillus terrae]|uniref:Lipoprotein n=1 Tax=Sporolactobacillus terrae TaxID=269673 RepID=A0ABX5QB70_9BACL|nr:hypothetical protein [Sporolactobacillus terrae]QAA23825.1 hypothetical protein C0674_15190 [Sporolactobacillus terrae]QAA26796.1 hypothetical protein C0679_15175 [Sporolactobacillus terrae]UAK15858.1 hypothetical protein K7399_12715 [Sporolactobacillus terrae]
MKKTLLALFIIVVLVLGGCANQEDKAYDQEMEKGQAALVSKDYDAAASAFKKALTHKEKDHQATLLLAQTNNFIHAKRSINQPAQTKKLLNLVINQEKGSAVLKKDAIALKKQVVTMREGSVTTASAASSSMSSSEAFSEESSSSAVNYSDETAPPSAAPSSSGSKASRSSSSTTEVQAQQKEAELAVIQAAGYSPNKVYIDTRDDGAYYSMELRENHKNDSAADSDTAPSIGFFRYYKNSGKVMQLDVLSNKYKEVKD